MILLIYLGAPLVPLCGAQVGVASGYLPVGPAKAGLPSAPFAVRKL